MIFLNKWFVDEANSTIGVDVSAYQADIDMEALKEQNIEFIYIKATEGSGHQDERFCEKNGFTYAGEADLLRHLDGIPVFCLYELNW